MARTKTGRIELSIATDYVKHWGVKEGVREFVANAMDARRAFGCEVDFGFDPDTRTIRVRTEGQALGRHTLLLGVSEKGDTDEAIGRFGEGYKIGSLALVRAGKSVTIFTGGEIWRPSFERSETFGAPVLGFDIAKDPAKAKKDAKPQVDVRIQGVTLEEWREISELFLLSRKPAVFQTFRLIGMYAEDDDKEREATVLYDEREKGRIYVGGVLVGSDESLSYGYDLSPKVMDVGRDRDALDSYKLKQNLACVWQTVFVAAVREDNWSVAAEIWEAFGSDREDFGSLEHASERRQFMDALERYYGRLHGKAHPVGTMKEAMAAQAMGLAHAFVPKRVVRFLRRRLALPDIEETFQHTVLESWSAQELPADEGRRLWTAWQIVREAGERVSLGLGVTEGKRLREPQAARFGGERILGLHVGDGRAIFVARTLLASEATFGDVITTLAHEWAHYHVMDHGSHFADIERRVLNAVVGRMMELLREHGALPEMPAPVSGSVETAA